ncbi:MAG: trypsin-like peptidase domain-containing protein [Clostridiales Family XIII bacterium]|nr:trypsin-like peptidase domain-containing protein [Clostridiales Family XIII bacterium]
MNAKCKAGIAAAMLACCLISGAAGSGFTALIGANSDIAKASAVTQNAAYIEAVQTATGTARSVTEISAIVSPAVVSVNVTATSSDRFGRTATTTGSGSGVILTENGYILTNGHVVEGATGVTVMLSTGQTYTAALVGADSQTDLAVLKIAETSLPFATLGDSASLRTGDLAVAIGNPLGELGGTVTAGIISATDREITIEGETMNLIQTDAAINPGNSGGALCNQYGEVIGVVNAKTSALGVEGLGFAIPINDAGKVAAELIEKGYVSGRASLGLSVQEVTSQTAAFFRTKAGVYAASLTPGGAAELAGIRTGDRIVSLDGQAITAAAEIKAVKEKHAPGDRLAIVVSRDGRDISLTITLREEI